MIGEAPPPPSCGKARSRVRPALFMLMIGAARKQITQMFPTIFRLLLFFSAGLLMTACNPPSVTGPLVDLSTTSTAPLKAMAASDPTAVLQGSVQLAGTAPDQNAGITVFLAGTGYQARTDVDGTYTITGVPRGEYNVIAEKPGFQTLTVERIAVDPDRHTRQAPAIVKSAVLERAGDELDLTTTSTAARRLGSILGNVYLENQDFSDGVRVHLENTGHVTVSDRDGSYRLLNIEPGVYTLTFTHPGFETYSMQVRVPSGADVRVEDAALPAVAQARTSPSPADSLSTIPLARSELSGTRAIVGLVLLPSDADAPPPDYSQVVVALDNSDIVVTPDAQGKFRLPDLPPGVYKVSAALEGVPASMQSQVVDLTDQQTAQVTFRFGDPADGETTGTGTVVGRVLLGPPPAAPGASPPPAPLPAVGVSVGISGSQKVVLTGPDGAFVLEEVPAGVHALVLAKDDYKDLTVSGIEVPAGLTADVGELVLEPRVEAPRVVSTMPEQGARNVLVAEQLTVVIDFSHPMDREALLRSIQIEPRGNFVPFIGSGAHELADDNTLVLVMSNFGDGPPIRYNTNYRFTILPTATSIQGIPMEEPYTLSFSTGGVGVARTFPAPGQDNITLDQVENPVQIIFNGPVDPKTLNDRTIKLRPSKDTYRINVTYDPNTGFTIAAILTTYNFGQNYSVTVTNRVRTVTGQPLTNTPYTFRFRSAEPIPVPYPDPVVR